MEAKLNSRPEGHTPDETLIFGHLPVGDGWLKRVPLVIHQDWKSKFELINLNLYASVIV